MYCIDKTYPILCKGDKVLFLLGNDAIARRALEAGVGFVSTYPSMSSMEIVEALASVTTWSYLKHYWSLIYLKD